MMFRSVNINYLRQILRKNDRYNNLFKIEFSMSIENDGKDGLISIDEVRTLKNNAKVLFVDVREPHEIETTGLIPGSINIPLNLVEDVLKNGSKEGILNENKLDSETPIVFTCRSGRRAGLAQEIAWKLGFKNVRNYKGSWNEWEKQSK